MLLLETCQGVWSSKDCREGESCVTLPSDSTACPVGSSKRLGLPQSLKSWTEE